MTTAAATARLKSPNYGLIVAICHPELRGPCQVSDTTFRGYAPRHVSLVSLPRVRGSGKMLMVAGQREWVRFEVVACVSELLPKDGKQYTAHFTWSLTRGATDWIYTRKIPIATDGCG